MIQTHNNTFFGQRSSSSSRNVKGVLDGDERICFEDVQKRYYGYFGVILTRVGSNVHPLWGKASDVIIN